MAAHKMASEPTGHTLQPTALVHEAWLRLVDKPNQSWQNHTHFFSSTAETTNRLRKSMTSIGERSTLFQNKVLKLLRTLNDSSQ
jgi:hypothetical protein